MSHIIQNLKSFTYPAYVELLEHLQSNYELITAKEYDPKCDEPTVVVRHDVDWSLESALHMARLENDLGIQSTYFVLLSCPTYNLFSEYGMDIIDEMLDLGHEIGLHYDIPIYNRRTEYAHVQLLEIEIASLERLIHGQKTSCISCHNTSILDYDPLRNVWLKNLSDFSQFDNFVHDANRIWIDKHLQSLIDVTFKRHMLLTHPCLWSDDSEYVADRYEWIHTCISKIEASWVNLWREKDEKLKRTNC